MNAISAIPSVDSGLYCAPALWNSDELLAPDRLPKINDQLAWTNAELKRTRKELHEALREVQHLRHEWEAAEGQLVQADKNECTAALAAGIAHELKNPLQTILLGIDYLAATTAPRNDCDFTATLADLRDAIHRADSLVHEFLDFSAANELAFAPCDPNEVLDRALSLVRYELIRNKVDVVRELRGCLPLVPMDPRKIEQVFVNLLLNAIQAMPRGGRVTVRTFMAPSDTGSCSVIAELYDTGPGIEEQNLTKIFEPFFTTKPPGIGTGLGLAVTKKIIELHGGEISIQNAPDGGAVAIVAFSGSNSINSQQLDPTYERSQTNSDRR